MLAAFVGAYRPVGAILSLVTPQIFGYLSFAFASSLIVLRV